MQVAEEIRYPADPVAVFHMLCDVEYQERKCRATGALDFRVQIDRHHDDEVTITTHRQMPTDHFPDFVRAMVGQSVQVVQTDTWATAAADGSRTGQITVELSGTPVQLTGTLRLVPGGTPRRPAAVQQVSGELKARVPLIGGKIERAAAPAIAMAIRAEQRTAEEWLAS